MNKILDLLSVAIYLKDSSGKYIWCNQYMLDILGYDSVNDIIGKTDYQMPWARKADSMRDIDEKVAFDQISYHHISDYIIFGGEQVVFFSIKEPCSFGADGIGIAGVMINLQADLLSKGLVGLNKGLLHELNQNSTDVVVQQIKHDIRSPLGAIISLSEMIEDVAVNSEVSKLVQMIRDAGFALNNCMTLGAYSLNESIKNSVFDIRDIVNNVVKIVTPIAYAKNIKCYYNFKEDNESWSVLSNKDMLHRMLMELMNNAIKNTKYGQVILSLDSFVDIEHNEYIVINIDDTGSGMPSNVLNKLMDPEALLDYDALKVGRGFGVGMVAAIAQKLQIKVVADSVVEQGTSIKLVIKKKD